MDVKLVTTEAALAPHNLINNFIKIKAAFAGISGGSGGVWGSITGTITDQLDLVAYIGAAVPANITTQGNTFNGANQLVQLNGTGQLPAVDGSLLTGISAAVNQAADYTWTGLHTFNKAVTAAAGVARATIFTPTLTASANNNILSGVYISPTFVNGAFTGVENYGLNVNASIRAGGTNSVSYWMPTGNAIRGEAASNGTMYIDASKNLTGTIHLRATSLVLPSFSNTSVTTSTLTVQATNTVALITGAGVTSFRIGNTTTLKTWYIENHRHISGALEFSKDVGATKAFILTQTNQAGVNVSAVDASAVFQVDSIISGFLIPRMTKAQRNAIASPASGLMVFQTDITPGLRTYNGTNWVRYTETSDA